MSTNSLHIRLIVAVMVAVAAVACSTANRDKELVEEAMRQARDNAGELQAVLDRYDEDERREAARYLIGATIGLHSTTGPGVDSVEVLYGEMPVVYEYKLDSAQLARAKRYEEMPLKSTPDAKTLKAEYLAANLEDAWEQYKSRKWNRGLPLDAFCEYILPYRVGDEKLTEWRKPYREWLAPLADTLLTIGNSVDAARLVSEFIKTPPYNDEISIPHRSALSLLKTPYGICRDDCDRTLYAMRSVGIPVAVDRMLISPDYSGSHAWTVVWDNDAARMRMFDNEDYRPTRDSLHYDKRRKGKIYRSTFVPNTKRLARYRKAKNTPSMLLNPWLRDVTAEYFGHNRAEVPIWPDAKTSEENAVYLGVFSNQSFRPVDIAALKGDRAVFTDMEPNLIYAPVMADGEICGYPFMLRRDGTLHSFVPDGNSRETVTLTRKYTLGFHQKDRLKSVVGIHFQSAPTARGPWTDLDVIDTTPTHSYRRINPDSPLTGRYLRIYNPDTLCKNRFGSEISVVLACRDTLGLDRLPLSVVGDDAARERYARILQPENSFGLEAMDEGCILHIDSPDDVAALFLLPRNDDNFVVPAQEYELLYFSGPEGWKSAGRRMSTGFSIDFEAPKGAVLWLRNLTKGREEQIFIWHDGRQLFNIDLYDLNLNAI